MRRTQPPGQILQNTTSRMQLDAPLSSWWSIAVQTTPAERSRAQDARTRNLRRTGDPCVSVCWDRRRPGRGTRTHTSFCDTEAQHSLRQERYCPQSESGHGSPSQHSAVADLPADVRRPTGFIRLPEGQHSQAQHHQACFIYRHTDAAVRDLQFTLHVRGQAEEH